eukprot:GILK01003642.1.p1 GENE.GILK01003642.1~~GILK01003642.1.p1  ORF type:complete len:599 (-),score=69.60 GILK01003642.1:100-1779(-)
MDTFSKSDPCVEVYQLINNAWIPIGRTEIIWNNLNPDFTKTFIVEYFFEEIQQLMFKVYDVDNDTPSLADDDFIGQATCTIGEIAGSRGQVVMKPLHRANDSNARGTLIARVEEVTSCREQATISLKGTHIENVAGFFSKSDPFVVISRSREDGSWVPVYQTPPSRSNLNPVWPTIQITVQKLCNGDHNRPLQLEVFDHKRNGDHVFIGRAQASLNDMRALGCVKIINPEKKAKKGKGYDNSGVINFARCDVVRYPTFVEYLQGGCELSLIVAIDFTSSNGDPNLPNSLHFRNPYGPNEYELAINAVGNILSDYDSDKKFPVFGFGGKVQGTVSHCFPLTFDPRNVEVDGVAGICGVYRRALDHVLLSGPTVFGPIMQAGIQYAMQHSTQQSQKYTILLILTDGVIHDMSATIDSIVQASGLPLSVVIVGVGEADFSQMVVLDADTTPLVDSHGRQMYRDIVQFVPFRSVANHPARLAKEVLAEIPEQLLSYMRVRNILPNPPLQTTLPIEPVLYPSVGQMPQPTQQFIVVGAPSASPTLMSQPTAPSLDPSSAAPPSY